HSLSPRSLHDALPISGRQGQPDQAFAMRLRRDKALRILAGKRLLAHTGAGRSGVVEIDPYVGMRAFGGVDADQHVERRLAGGVGDRKSTRLNSSHRTI